MKLSKTIDKIRPSVVQVTLGADDPEHEVVLGTGFAVGESATIVTALHVVTEVEAHVQRLGGEQLRVGILGPTTDQKFSCVAHSPTGPPMSWPPIRRTTCVAEGHGDDVHLRPRRREEDRERVHRRTVAPGRRRGW